MNVLLIDQGANFVDFALRCQKAGHAVKLFIGPDKNGERLRAGDGLIEKISDFKKWMRWADIVLLSDNVKYLSQMEPYRKLGYPIFGCNVAAAEMELNRTVGQDVWKKAGVPIMDYKTFTNYDDAIKFVERNATKRYVSKPSGDVAKELSYVSQDSADMRDMLRRWKKQGKLKVPFILQEFKPGVEVAVGGYFGPAGWSSQFNINFEHKKTLAGDLGVNCGEQGTVIAYCTQREQLVQKLLLPASDYLMQIGYTGYVDAAAIVDKDGPWPLEWTCRPGWPHNQIISSLNAGDPVEWMVDLLDGYDSLKVKPGVVTGVVMTMGDFPFNKMPRDSLTGIPVHCDYEDEGIHPCEIMTGVASEIVGNKIVDMPTWVSTGSYLLVATGVADTVSGSARKAYATLKSISVPNSPGYRIDIGQRLKKQLPMLHDMGYCKGIEF